ncbi:MAG: DUF4347 domain-containing protein, partial [Mariprofundaceae bacterium]
MKKSIVCGLVSMSLPFAAHATIQGKDSADLPVSLLNMKQRNYFPVSFTPEEYAIKQAINRSLGRNDAFILPGIALASAHWRLKTTTFSEIVFVDPGVAEYKKLISALPSGTQVIMLNASRPAVVQMAEALASRRDIDAIHVISHGQAGEISFSHGSLNSETVGDYVDHFAAIGNSMTASGDILFYGCNVAASKKGKVLVQRISTLTGADVAASNDLTASLKNGDWELEVRSGSIEAAPLLSLNNASNYRHALVTTAVSTVGALRTAITTANASGTSDIINLAAGTYTLSGANNEDLNASGDLDINKATGTLTIQKDPAAGSTPIINANRVDRVLDVLAGSNVTVDGITLQNGLLSGIGGDGKNLTGAAGTGALGGGIRNAVTLTIQNSTVTANKATGGGGGGCNSYGGGGGSGVGGIGGGNGGCGYTTSGTCVGAEGGLGSGGGGGGGGGSNASTSGPQPLGGSGSAGNGGAGGHSYNGGVLAGSVVSGGGGGGQTAGGIAGFGTYGGGNGGSGGYVGGIGGGGGAGTYGNNSGMLSNPGNGGAGGGAIGGIYNTGSLTVLSTTVSNNSGSGGGGGGGGAAAGRTSSGGVGGNGVGTIQNAGGTLNYNNTVTFSGNAGSAGAGGGGIPVGAAGTSSTANTPLTTGGGTTDPAFSSNSAPTFTGTPAITQASAVVGDSLSLSSTGTNDTDGNTVTLSYQWKANGTNVAVGGTASTYTPTTSEAHKTMTCVVTGNDGQGAGNSTVMATTAGLALSNSAQAFSGTPVIAQATPTVVTQLTLNSTATTDGDSDTVTLSYQWKANTVNISGATSSFYALTATEAHKTITCAVSGNDGQGAGNSPLAAVTTAGVAVSNTAPANTVVPAITGTPSVGNALSSSTGTWTDADNDSLSFTYQWFRANDNAGTGEAAIGSATNSSYTLIAADAHKFIKVVVTANDSNGSSTVTGTSTRATITNSAPANTVVPAITGTPSVGNALSSSTGTWTDADNDSLSFTYQWFRANDNAGTGEAAIGSATNSSYTLIAADNNKFLRAVVTANDSNGSSNQTATSTRTQIANSAPTASAVSASGTTTVGNTLTGSYTYNDVDGDSEGTSTFRWLRNNVAITGATISTYMLVAADSGTTIKFEVTPVAAAGATTGTAIASAGTSINSAPTASAVSASGTVTVGNTLTGSYTYNDVDGDSEG